MTLCNCVSLTGFAVLSLSSHGTGLWKQDATSEAKAEITAKYAEYDRAIALNDAGQLLQFYTNDATENYTEEVKGRCKRTRKTIQEALAGRMRTFNRAFDVIAVKGQRTSIQQFRLGEGLAVVKTEEKNVAIRQQVDRSRARSTAMPRKVNEVTVQSKMEIWYYTSFGWKLENTRVMKRASVATYIADKQKKRAGQHKT